MPTMNVEINSFLNQAIRARACIETRKMLLGLIFEFWQIFQEIGTLMLIECRSPVQIGCSSPFRGFLLPSKSNRK